MRIYISGKIGETVISEATRRKFAEAEEMLKARGYEVFNPTDERWQWVLKKDYEIQYFDSKRTTPTTSVDFYTYALLRDLMVLSQKGAIYMLPDFLDSPGSKAEHAFAIATGKQIYYDEELYRDGTLRAKCYQKNRLPPAASIENTDTETK